MVGKLLPVVTLLAALLANGCGDPRGEFDEFANRVVDAAIIELPDAPILIEIPDITGEFLFAMEPAPDPGKYIMMLGTVVLTVGLGEASLTFTIVPLDLEDRSLAGDPMTVEPTVIPVSATGEFEIGVSGILPGNSNPVSGTELEAVMTANSRIVDADFWCGTVDGDVVAPITLSLDGSTFGAVRIPSGTDIMDIELRWRCPD